MKPLGTTLFFLFVGCAIPPVGAGLVTFPASIPLWNLDDAAVLLDGPVSERTLLLHFWATWCEPCRDEMPRLSRLVEESCGEDVHVVAVNVEEEVAAVIRFMDQHEIGMQVLRDPAGEVFRRHVGGGLPANVWWAGAETGRENRERTAADWTELLATLGCAAP